MIDRKKAAKEFAEKWKGRGYEKGDTQVFWLTLLQKVLGAENADDYIRFEEQVVLDHTSFMDGHIEKTHVLIEQKSLNKSLDAPIKQSDGSMLTPFEQAKRYSSELPYSKRPRWIVTCNFAEFYIYDMEKVTAAPEKLRLEDLPQEYYRLSFLVDEGSSHIKREFELSIKAGDIVGKLYDKLRKRYIDPDSPASLKSLNKLCVRLVFCLYAEDAEIFGKKDMFCDYLKNIPPTKIRKVLIELFGVLDTEEEDRDPYLEPELAAFPYVNGGLFAKEDIEIPNFDEELKNLLLNDAGMHFDWSGISPTIFGAVFESTLNPETRRSGGMHYTSIENIHKVIDPLFLDDLKKELEEIKALPHATPAKKKIFNARLEEYQDKLASLVFLDPAAGSGNFLTETYTCLRRLENEAISLRHEGEMTLGAIYNPIRVNIAQFYGIEINDFAVSVAKTALWIAESQMMKETEAIVNMELDFLPLTTNAGIVEGNALRMNWEDVVPKNKLNYIMGNPPFSAGRRMGNEHRKEMCAVAAEFPNNGELDYVTAWYILAAHYMQKTNIKSGFVSTSSICQGEQVILLWKILFEKYRVQLFHAVRSFLWANEGTNGQASVHCIILEFTCGNYYGKCTIRSGDNIVTAEHINGYLVDAPNLWIEGRKKSLSGAPSIANGSKPLDNAICAFTPEEKEDFLTLEPLSAPYFYKYMGSREFINNIERWFLLINRIPPHLLRKMPHVLEKKEAVRQYRLKSRSVQTQKLAATPDKFHFENIPETNYLVIPQTSSGRRKYIPIGFLTPNVLVNNKLQVMRDGGLYELGVLSSGVHNAWVRIIAGRFRDDFTYSVSIVYNNFPWPMPTDTQKAKIVRTAQGILEAREKYPESSLADLYDEMTMPYDLKQAHLANDKAVMEAYRFSGKPNSDLEIVAELMKMYKALTEKQA